MFRSLYDPPLYWRIKEEMPCRKIQKSVFTEQGHQESTVEALKDAILEVYSSMYIRINSIPAGKRAAQFY